MKKISTAAGKTAKKFRDHKLTIGLDLGDRSSWYCVLDEAGEVLLEQRLATTPKAMKEVFGGMPRSRIALETGMHSPWASRLLSDLGHEVIVAHARNVRLIGESRKKDDRLDARTLARLARIDPPWRLTTKVSPSHVKGSLIPSASIRTFRRTRVLLRDSRATGVEVIRTHLCFADDSNQQGTRGQMILAFLASRTPLPCKHATHSSPPVP